METAIQWKSDEALYLQFAGLVRRLIGKREWTYGQKVPSLRQLAAQYGIDRRTAAKALDLLAAEGLLARRDGGALYVGRPSVSIDVKRIEGFAGLMKTSGGQGETRVLSSAVQPAGRKLAGILAVPEGTPLYVMARLRLVDGQPMAVEYTYLREDLIDSIGDIDFSVYSLYHVLENHGFPVARVDEKISFIQISNPEAKLLQIPLDEAAYLMEDTSYNAKGRPLEYTRAYANSQLQITGELT